VAVVHGARPIIGWILYLTWVSFIGVAFSNSVNVTDGLDGLAAGAGIFVTGAYSLIAFWQFNQACYGGTRSRPARRRRAIPRPTRSTSRSCPAAFVGALVGFLWWNAPKANVFMGDVGSMAIGGVIAAMAILTRTELLAVLVAGVFIIGPGSVILQRLYFRVTPRQAPVPDEPVPPPSRDARLVRDQHRRADVDHRGPARGSRASASSTSSGSRRHERRSAVQKSRLDALTSWHADWKGLRVAVLGLSVTGFSACRHPRRARRRRARRHREGGRGIRAAASRHRGAPLDRSLDAVPQELVDFAPDVGGRLAGVRAPASAHPVDAGIGRRLWGDIELALAGARQGSCAPTGTRRTGCS
jgi:hypothetical protein